jgi:NOL1/NOP2/fmu family ribosome biogenesis protein
VVALPQFPGFMPGRPDWTELTTKDTKSTKGKGLEGAVRLFPHRIAGEGHFACLLRKSGGEEGRGMREAGMMEMSRPQAGLWGAFAREVLAAAFDESRLRVRGERLYLVPEEMPGFGTLRVAHPGVWLGTFKKERFEPAHPLALFLRPGQVRNTLDLAAGEVARPGGRRPALQAYLAGETLPSEGPSGWSLVTADGWPLGWGKRVQGVLKNHYPRGWQVYS